MADKNLPQSGNAAFSQAKKPSQSAGPGGNMVSSKGARPTMGLADATASFRYYVEIHGILEGWFTECKGLTLQRDVFEYKEGGVNNFIHKLPAQIKLGNVTLRRGMTQSRELMDWAMKGIFDGKVQYVNLSIILYDSAGSVVRRWNLERAYPVKLIAPDLKSDAKAAAIESLEIAFHGLTIA